MLVCYLDDSGKDPQSPLTTVAGYVAREEDWATFEAAVEPVFDEYKVPILHATELKSTKGPFKDWTVLKKQSFVSQVCLARNPNAMLGLTASAEKEGYKEYRKQFPQASSPYTICFNQVLDQVLRNVVTGKAANEEGVAFILECGHENNMEAKDTFNEIRKNHGLEGQLKSICFVPKDNCRAIQLADLLAFYGRRDHVSMYKARLKGSERYPQDTMVKIIVEGLSHWNFAATGFHPRNDPQRPPWEPPWPVSA